MSEQIDRLWLAISEYVYWACQEVKADIQQIDQGESRRLVEAGKELHAVLKDVLGA